ncbi:MAG: hypothetical protein P9L88_07150 [Candidatus Tantalella remota]|nr:hypothetical protein [Candidatus Tantalella remota]
MMRVRVTRHTITLAISFVLVVLSVVRAYAIDQQVEDRYPGAQPPPPTVQQLEQQEEWEYDPKDHLRTGGYIDQQMGYDNNVDLDSKRHKDGFSQTMANINGQYTILDNVKLKAGLDLFTTIYFRYNKNNILDISPFVGLDWDIMDSLSLRTRLIYDGFFFPNDEESTFNGLYLKTYLRHYITKDFYQEGGVEYLMRWYPDQKTYLTNGFISDKDRFDKRVRFKYNLGYFSENFFVGLSNEFARNDSNDTFEQYYDYWLYRLRPSIMYFFTDKFYTDLSLVYKYTHYKDRRATNNINNVERDNTYIFNSSFYYDIKDDLTVSVTYSYSENSSNDPFEKYSGSVITAGIYYTF